MRTRAMTVFALGGLMSALGACSDSDMGQVSLQVSTRGPASLATGTGELGASEGAAGGPTGRIVSR